MKTLKEDGGKDWQEMKKQIELVSKSDIKKVKAKPKTTKKKTK